MSAYKQLQKSAVFAIYAVAIVILTGCGGSNLKIGPVTVETPLTQGTLDPDELQLPKDQFGQTDIEYALCQLVTEDEVNAMLRDQVGEVVASLLRVTELDVREITIEAYSGDFSGLRQIAVYYLPVADDSGGEEPILLGEAQSLVGFSSVITLTPPDSVDLLPIIRDHEDNSGDKCPSLIISVTGYTPDSPIEWNATITVDAYARIAL